MPLPELLAPAGNQKALVAAVQSGADAVYLGLREFSARRGAENFSVPELAEAVRYAHLRGVRVYLTLNVLVLPDEVDRAVREAAEAREAGVDAFIVQDLGLASLLARHLPDVRLHASTQMSTHTPDGVAALAALGFRRVTLARELSLPEMASCAGGAAEIEVFAHGALCYCYSGQCLLSSMVGGRSGNRGLCVQACRLAYELADDRRGPIEAGGDFPLSTRDLCAIDLIPDLVRAGVASLKIEGRLKSPEYVATVVDVYRRALDRYAAEPSGNAGPSAYAVPPEDREALEEVFSRGFSEAYLAGIRDGRMMSPARPSDRGVTIGRVASHDSAAGTCDIRLTRGLGLGDEIEIWVRKGGRVATTVDKLMVGDHEVEAAAAGEVATVVVNRPVGREDRVFRTANRRVLEWARERLRPVGASRTVGVDVAARLRAGEALRLSAASSDGFEVAASGSVVKAAAKKAIDAASVAEHLGRLGGTAYHAREITIDMEGDCFIAFSEINRARQDLVAQLDAARLQQWRREPAEVVHERLPAHVRRAGKPMLAASVDDRRTARALAVAGLDWLYFDVSFDRDWESLAGELAQVATMARGAGARFALQLPAIVHESELEELDGLVDALGSELNGLVVGSIGQARRYGRAYADDRGSMPLLGDMSLNATNARTAHVLSDIGVERVALSAEITGGQIEEIASTTKTRLEVLIFGRLQVMVAEHCLYSAPASCANCGGRAGDIRDAKGFVFPVRIDRACRTRVYNPFDVSLVKQLPELSIAGIDVVRLNLGGYASQIAAGLVTEIKSVLSLLPDEPEAAGEIAERLSGKLRDSTRYTTGHYFRPVK